MTDKLPTMRVNGQDVDSLLGLYAAISQLEATGKTMERRIRSVPGGWRDIRCAVAQLTKLGENLTATWPREKLPGLRRMLPKVRIKLTVGPQACKGKEETVIGFDDLDVIISAARDRCKMCADWTRGKCGKCELGKVLDHVLRYDRKDKNWDDISDEEIAKE